MGMMIVTAPFWSIAVLMHYLALKTCKAPVWPQEIEAVCKFDADDPYRLPEERYGKGHPRSREAWDAANALRDRNLEVLRKWERQERTEAAAR